MRLMITGLILLTAMCVNAERPLLLADSLSPYFTGFVLLESGLVLFIDHDGDLCRVDIGDPMSVEPLDMDWSPEEAGWARPGQISFIKGSQDGSLICFGQQVSVPDDLQNAEMYTPGPITVLVASTDGSDCRMLALVFEVGGGPNFDFTMDSEYIYGQPILGCLPNPADYMAYWSGDDGPEIEGFIIDVLSGERSGGNGAVLGDGYYANPWSDLTAAGAYPPNVIVDITTQEVLLESAAGDNADIISTWVLPDAGLAWKDDSQILRYADGREVHNPAEDILIYGRLSDGSYLFSIDSYQAPVLCGKINWETFDVADADTIDGLDGYLGPWASIRETPDGNGLLFESSNSLYLINIPRD